MPLSIPYDKSSRYGSHMILRTIKDQCVQEWVQTNLNPQPVLKGHGVEGEMRSGSEIWGLSRDFYTGEEIGDRNNQYAPGYTSSVYYVQAPGYWLLINVFGPPNFDRVPWLNNRIFASVIYVNNQGMIDPWLGAFKAQAPCDGSILSIASPRYGLQGHVTVMQDEPFGIPSIGEMANL